MNRRSFIAQAGAALASVTFAPAWSLPQNQPDVKLEIAPLDLEIAPGKLIHTGAYNGRVPGPLIRCPEGKPIVLDVLNRTSVAEIGHWHAPETPPAVDAAVEEA